MFQTLKASPISFLIVLHFGVLPCNVHAQFTDVTSSQLIIQNINEGTIYGDGVSFYDFTGDGWDDLTIANGSGNPWFFVNNQGNFDLAPFTITNPQNKLILMMLWADYDGDGDADLLITKDQAPLQLWQNDGNLNFTNVAASAGLEQASYSYWGAAFADYDHDGCLDLFIAKYYHPTFNPGSEFRCKMYHNNCDGTFTENTLAAGIDLPPRPCFQPVFMDYNNDGWEDIFLVIDRIQFQNELFENNGDGTFTQVTASSGVGVTICSMTGTIDDFDNDLDEDVYVTNGPNGNVLMQNNGDETFTDKAEVMGVELNQLCWGAMWIDYDNNAWLDLFVSISSPYLDPIGNQLFINNEGTGFTNGTDVSGFDSDETETYQVAMGDFNNDGYYDFVTNNKPPYISQLWQNLGGPNNYLSLNLKGVVANRDGIGSWIHCYAGGEHYARFTHCGENFTAQNSGKEIFGLGSVETVDSLVVEWNSGAVDTYYSLNVNQHLTISEGSSILPPFTITHSGDLVLCEGESEILQAIDGVSYLWSTGATSQSIEVNDAGTYSVNVINSEGIMIHSSPLVISSGVVPQPEINLVPVNCSGGNDGSALLSLIEDEIVSITWSNGSNDNPVEGLEAGNYSFDVLSTQGCHAEGSFEVTEPDGLMAENELNPVSCYGGADGSAVVSASGGVPPYSINWNSADPNALSAGEYQIEITDLHNCLLTDLFTITQPDSLEVMLTTGSVSCFGGDDGTVQMEITGGTPDYQIDWYNKNPLQLHAGSYEAAVTDGNECLVVLPYEISEPEELIAEVSTTNQVENGMDGTATLVATGGTSPFQIAWSSGEFDVNQISDLDSGSYSVQVTDFNGCEVTLEFEIDFVSGIDVYNQHQLHLFPVPADEQLRMEGLTGTNELIISDYAGRTCQRFSVTGNTALLDVRALPNGIYSLSVRSEYGLWHRTFLITHANH